MIRTDRRIRICGILLVLNLCFIWGNSLLPGELSGALSDWVKDLLASLLPVGEDMPSQGGLLRKLAHFTEFTMLGVLLSWLFGMLRRKPYWPFLCGFLTACIDETIQCFVPDRGPGIVDVMIDTCGVVTGMLLLFAGYAILKRKQ